VKAFRHYLLGSPFEIKVMSDRQSLQYLKKGREATGRIARWAMALSKYNYQIEYWPGKKNLLGDALSRLVAIEMGHIAEATQPRQTAELASLFLEVHSEIAWLVIGEDCLYTSTYMYVVSIYVQCAIAHERGA
jgi:hypothetical protein